MKKSSIISVVISAFLLSNMVNAQDIKFGVKGSFLMSNFSVQDNGWQKFMPGYDAGLYIQYNVLDFLAVSFEPVYALEGANDINPDFVYHKESPIFTDKDYKVHNIALSVIELPLLAHLNMDFGGTNMRLFAGPSLGVITKANRISERQNVSVGDSDYNNITSQEDITDRFVYNNYSAVVGVGFDIEMDPVDLRIDIKYQHGFTNINNVENKPGITTDSFGISLGIGLDKLFF